MHVDCVKHLHQDTRTHMLFVRPSEVCVILNFTERISHFN
jgi:hypothetical protein